MEQTPSRGGGRLEAYQDALLSHGVPGAIAFQTAEILDRETTSWEGGTPYQRTPEEQLIISNAHQWIASDSDANHPRWSTTTPSTHQE